MNKSESAVNAWLESHRSAHHTRRAYEREWRRLEYWLQQNRLAVATATSTQIERYLIEYAAGKVLLPPLLLKSGKPSTGSVFHVRLILRLLFEALQQSSLRRDNPVWSIPPLARPPRPTENPFSKQNESRSWLTERIHWIQRISDEAGSRDPLARAVAVADFSFWTGMRRSELAAAVMSDISGGPGKWRIGVRRFGSGEVQAVRLADPAMDVLRIYRMSRDLPDRLSSRKTDIPLISRLEEEAPVTAWTVASSLCLLARSESATKGAEQADQRNLCARGLRGDLILRSLELQIPARDLSSHLRTPNAISSVAQAMPAPNIDALLRKVSELAERAASN